MAAYEMTILDIDQIIFLDNCLIFMTFRLTLAKKAGDTKAFPSLINIF